MNPARIPGTGVFGTLPVPAAFAYEQTVREKIKGKPANA